MMTLIIGPNDSGKSAFAEEYIARRAEGPLYYVATMIPYGDAGRARVERHRALRQGRGFIVMERPAEVHGLEIQPESAVLLEDASNLLANAIFEFGRDITAVRADIRALRDKCALLVVVSIGGLEIREEYDAGTADYIRNLLSLNEWLEEMADETVIMRGGKA